MNRTHRFHGIGLRAGRLLLVASLLAGVAVRPVGAQTGLELSTAYTLAPNSYPTGLIYGPAGSFWLTLGSANAVAQIELPSTAITIPLTETDSRPYDLTVGPDRAIWFTEQKAGQIGRIDPAGSLTEYALPDRQCYPSGIVLGQDGGLWFTEYYGNRIGRIAYDGTLIEYPLPQPDSRPLGIASALDGSLWFTEWNRQRIGRITTDGDITEWPIVGIPWRPTEIALGPDGNLWVLFAFGQTVMQIDATDGSMTLHQLGSDNAGYLDLAIGPDGRLWLLSTLKVSRLSLPVGSPPEIESVMLNPSVYESQGRSQLISGPGDEIFLISAKSQDVSRVSVPDAIGRDLQLFFPLNPPVMLAAGAYELNLSVVNWSSQPATEIVLDIPLPESLHFLDAPVPGLTCAEVDRHAVCELASLAGGERLDIPIFFHVDRILSQMETRFLEVQISSAELDSLPANNRQYRTMTIQRTIEYTNDFSVSADDHWSHPDITSPDGDLQYLGGFDNDNVTLTFPNLPHHDRAQLCYDLYILGGWDGGHLIDPADNNPTPAVIGPDLWAHYIDTTMLRVTTFSNNLWLTQSFPFEYNEGESQAQSRATQVGSYDADPGVTDSLYQFCTSLVHTRGELKYTFYGANLDALSGEQWALDNVFVRVYYHAVYDWLYMPFVIK